QRDVDLRPVADPEAVRTDGVWPGEHPEQHPEHVHQPPDAEDQQWDANVWPGAYDDVDDRQLDGGHAHEHDQNGEHGLVVAEPDRARRNPGSPEDEPEDALVAADLQHGRSAREIADASPTG